MQNQPTSRLDFSTNQPTTGKRSSASNSFSVSSKQLELPGGHTTGRLTILQRTPKKNPTKCGRSVRKTYALYKCVHKVFLIYFFCQRAIKAWICIFSCCFCNFPQISYWWVCFWQHGPDALLIQYALGVNPSQWQWQMKVDRIPLQHMYQKFQVPKMEVLTYISFM